MTSSAGTNSVFSLYKLMFYRSFSYGYLCIYLYVNFLCTVHPCILSVVLVHKPLSSSQICGLNLFCWLRIFNLGTPFFADWKDPKIRKNKIFLLIDITLKALVLEKISPRNKACRRWILQWNRQKGTRFLNRDVPSTLSYGEKLANFRLLAWNTNEILWICDLGINLKKLHICEIRTETPNKFADLWQRNEVKNLRICELPFENYTQF
jgi:hypothetical protein